MSGEDYIVQRYFSYVFEAMTPFKSLINSARDLSPFEWATLNDLWDYVKLNQPPTREEQHLYWVSELAAVPPAPFFFFANSIYSSFFFTLHFLSPVKSAALLRLIICVCMWVWVCVCLRPAYTCVYMCTCMHKRMRVSQRDWMFSSPNVLYV